MTTNTYLLVLKTADQQTLENGVNAVCVQADNPADAISLVQAVLPNTPATVVADAFVTLLGTGTAVDTSGMSVSVAVNSSGGTYVYNVSGGLSLKWSDLGPSLATAIGANYQGVTFTTTGGTQNIVSIPNNLGEAEIDATVFVGEAAQAGLQPVVSPSQQNPATVRTIQLPDDGNYAKVFFLAPLFYPGPPYYVPTQTYGD